MKRCPKCETVKETSEFAKHARRSDGLQSICKPCKKAIDAASYQGNKQWYIDRNTKFRNIARDYVRQLKESNPCADCKLMLPWYVMDFDHLDATTKVRDIASMVQRGLALDTIKKEIAKCEIVCANCHRIRTHMRRLQSGVGELVDPPVSETGEI